MNYEKKYNEAMLRADEAVQKGCLDKAIFDEIFPPEESEDERIRKWIITELKDSLHEIETMYSGDYDNRDEEDKKRQECLNKALAWLESQNEQKHSAPNKYDEKMRKKIIDHLESIKMGCVICTIDTSEEIAWLEKLKGLDKMIVVSPEVWDNAISDAFENGKKEGEKQKYDRMKPVYDNQDSFESALGKAWKDYNDSGARTVDGCEDNYVECAHAKGFREGYLFWLEKQKEPVPTQQPTEQQMHDLNEAIKGFRMDGCERMADSLHSLYIFLKSAYHQPMQEQKPAWSEEDEKMLKCCLIAINHYEKTCNIGDHLPTKFNIDGYFASVDKVKSWLKSLRPGWKPTEEQMEALNAMNCYGELSYQGQQQLLIDLYQQLKKL